MSRHLVGQAQQIIVAHSILYCIVHAAGLHDVSIGIGYFEYDLDDGTTGAAGHGLTASYDEVMSKAF